MAREARKEELYLYFTIDCEWAGMVGGSQPLRPTLPDHLSHLLEQEETKLRRQRAKQKPFEAEIQTENGEILSSRRQWLEKALSDPVLDIDAKEVIKEVLREEESPGEMLARTIARATTTFPSDNQRGFYVPAVWWLGATKAALNVVEGLHPDQARRIVKNCVSFYPERLFLEKKSPDLVKEMNVVLEGSSSQQAKATIKRIHLVQPPKEFTLVLKTLNSPFAKPLIEALDRILRSMGESIGVGGGRPEYGRFNVISCERIEADEAEKLIVEINK